MNDINTVTSGSAVSGTVFNIQKFSLNDGPGIRTVVFLKGCPLHCLWCSNPESQSPKPQILWDEKKCLHCGHCVLTCPEGAVHRIDPHGALVGEAAKLAGTLESATAQQTDAMKGANASAEQFRIHVDHHHCTGCGHCLKECPGKALKTEGETKTVADVLRVVMQDLAFYEESGGGITLSGGELLMQPRFASALLKEAKKNGLDTAVETTGFAVPAVFNEVTKDVDHFMIDLKHWDERAHVKWTGVSNRYPLQNMKHATETGKDVLPRIPVIPGVNDSPEDAAGFVKRLQEAGASKVQLLPFHQFGENKYAQLGKDYAFTDVKALKQEDLEEYRQIFLKAGIDAFF